MNALVYALNSYEFYRVYNCFTLQQATPTMADFDRHCRSAIVDRLVFGGLHDSH